jgi:signal transduction histidine kinase
MGRHFLVTVAPFVDGKGRMSGCIHIARDITDRKRSEKLALNAERLEAVSEVASGVAHHFNNTMQIVSGYAELAEMSLDIGDIEGARTDIERIKKGSKFAAEIVRRLQGFVHNRRGSYAPDTINLASVLQQAAEITQMWIGLKRDGEGPVVEFILDLAPDLHVHGIENDLLEVATHLMRNAVEASPNGGVVQVSAASQDDCVVFMVRDTGPGIPEEDLGRVFEPFFTTKGCTRTGLGLSSCMGIIRSHGGEISLSCPPGGGTIIHVCLPAAVKPVEK